MGVCVMPVAANSPCALPHTFNNAVDDDVDSTASRDVVDVLLNSRNVFKAIDSEGDGLQRSTSNWLPYGYGRFVQYAGCDRLHSG